MITGERFEAGVGHNYALDIVPEGCAILNTMEKQKAGKKYWNPLLVQDK